ncbi:MAG: hypothetical protein ABI551_12810, partial [Polyangiaceae bacterium]
VGVSDGQAGWSGNLVAPEGSKSQPKFGNGEKGTFTVKAPSVSGSWAIYEIVSQSTDSSIKVENPRPYFFGVYTK